MNERVGKAWQRYGEHRGDGMRFRPLGKRVVVQTQPFQQKTQSGLVWLAPSATSMFSGPMHLRRLVGLVMEVGPQVKKVKVGEAVLFVRRDFAHLAKYQDGTYCGFVDEAQILGFPHPEDVYME